MTAGARGRDQGHVPIREKVVECSKRDGLYQPSYGDGFLLADVPFSSPVVNRSASLDLAVRAAQALPV